MYTRFLPAISTRRGCVAKRHWPAGYPYRTGTSAPRWLRWTGTTRKPPSCRSRRRACTWAAGADALSKARYVNEFAAQVDRDHPDRFGFFAMLPLPDVEGSPLRRQDTSPSAQPSRMHRIMPWPRWSASTSRSSSAWRSATRSPPCWGLGWPSLRGLSASPRRCPWPGPGHHHPPVTSPRARAAVLRVFGYEFMYPMAVWLLWCLGALVACSLLMTWPRG